MTTSLFRIYFGTAIPGSEDTVNFNEFLDTIADAFPSGFTVLYATGAWADRETGRTIYEVTAVVELLTDNADAVRTLAKLYKETHGQDSVLVTRQVAEVDFL